MDHKIGYYRLSEIHLVAVVSFSQQAWSESERMNFCFCSERIHLHTFTPPEFKPKFSFLSESRPPLRPSFLWNTFLILFTASALSVSKALVGLGFLQDLSDGPGSPGR